MESLLSYGKVALIILEVIVIFNLLIVVHELGHFLAARWRGLVVEKFGIWFGKPIWKKTINGVEYSLGSIPAGGFVALPQMAPMEAIEGESATDRAALPAVSALDKIIVAFAGPLFSFMLAVAFAVVVSVVGKPVRQGDAPPVIIGAVAKDSSAWKSGLRAGDEILEVDGRPVRSFNGMSDSVAWNVISSEGKTIPVKVKRAGEILTFEPEPFRREVRGFGRTEKRQLPIAPAETPMIAKILPGSRAEKAGLRVNDVIVLVGDKPILSLADIDAAQDAKPGEPVPVTVERGGQRIPLLFPPAITVVKAVIKGAPADLAGFKPGDQILLADGNPATYTKFSQLAQSKLNQPFEVSLRRGDETKTVTVTPLLEVNNKLAMIGIEWDRNADGIIWDDWGVLKITHPGILDQLVQPVRTMINTFGALFSAKSELNLKDLSGPVGISRIYYHLLNSEEGWRLALWFSVFMNVNLALLNLLPIPVLDGGHITLALLEMVRRKPVSMRVLEVVQTACAVVIIGFMLYVTVFDTLDLPFLKRGRPAVELKFVPADQSGAKATG